MIQVEGLSKKFGDFTAVDNISFRVDSGEIVGFLGPNGAGKTTTMRILSSYIAPTSGKASVGGFDVVRNSLEVRKRIGYMPESIPFYTEMRVKEYLSFRAKLKGVARKERRNRIAFVSERCRIKEFENKIIGHLSKGQRQRVGLADAIIHNPPILILDEPTIGLDPHQIKQTRELIKELGKDHTVILSTHILPEVGMLCNRVIIIHQGRIAAMDTLSNLVKEQRIKVEIQGPISDIENTLKQIENVKSVSYTTDNLWNIITIELSEVRDIREQVYQKIMENRWIIREFKTERTTLEDIFIKITAREEGTSSAGA
ncbi:MAG: ATP-binding cassette domain-containing protein [Planctomycetota bacterium]|nr:ATP-binding cassette domain-containing protein [Planctomycetota bacterium]MDI6786912.1 ATP-binding cassette domain-containing protein [Planctomycetota bacterium]